MGAAVGNIIATIMMTQDARNSGARRLMGGEYGSPHFVFSGCIDFGSLFRPSFSVLTGDRHFRVVRVPILAPTDLHGLSVLDHLEQELPDVVMD
ncbi:MAG: hypothetical protein WA703_07910, partial [Pseudolabrys sp.]